LGSWLLFWSFDTNDVVGAAILRHFGIAVAFVMLSVVDANPHP
jgi:hypothetical protein